jgi:hypothetical protein
MWENKNFGHLYALSIPHHAGKDLPVGTRNSILDQLDGDLMAWDEWLSDEAGEDEEEQR